MFKKISSLTLFSIVSCLIGCSSKDMPSKTEVKDAYNVILASKAPNLRVNEVTDLDCKFEKYDFPEVKKIPNYTCNTKMNFNNNGNAGDELTLIRGSDGTLHVIATKKLGYVARG